MKDHPAEQKAKQKLDYFGQSLSEILIHSRAVPGKALRWTIIANPRAGGFTIGRRWKRHEAALAKTVRAAAANPRRDAGPSRYALSAGGGPAGLLLTTGPGRALDMTASLCGEAAGESGTFHLIVTAGGDGTSLEALEALYQAPAEIRNRCAVLRLPLGTGNDGAEAWELEDALQFLLVPTRVDFARGLKLSTARRETWPEDGAFPGKPLLAFNILSVGLDAFVTHMTNRMKGSLPGDSYKLWVDIAALLYDRIYRVGPMELTAFGEDEPEGRHIRERVLLCAMGAGGRRSYGSHKMILPDERNVCVVRQMPLLRKVALKGLFTTGEHIHAAEASLFNARRIVLSGEHPILAQMDGETVLLEKEDFPVVMELTEALIPVLRRI
jgi:diacylglycerol kinase family enzyme